MIKIGSGEIHFLCREYFGSQLPVAVSTGFPNISILKQGREVKFSGQKRTYWAVGANLNSCLTTSKELTFPFKIWNGNHIS